MKKLMFILAATAALFAFASCQENDPAPSVPANIDAAFTNLVKGDLVKGDVNKFPVSASVNGSYLDLTFYSDNIYIPAGSYTVGTAKGNYEGRFKNDDVDAAIKSGAITVEIEGEGNYTMTGTLRLDNEVGTILNLSATGSLPYETPTEFYYTVEEQTINGTKANVYKIYDLEYHPVAEAACTGAEDGTYDVADNTLVPVTGTQGTWVYVEGYGTEVYLHGKVTVSTTFGKKTFSFEDNHTVVLPNCQLKQDLTPNIVDNGMLSGAYYTINVVKSPVVKDMYELTMKLFHRLEGDVLGPEFMSGTMLTPESDWLENHLGMGYPAPIVPYNEYAEYDSEKFADFNGRLAPEGACFFYAHGVRTTMGLTADTGLFLMGHMSLDPNNELMLWMCPTNEMYGSLASLDAVTAAGIWSCMATPAPEN